MKIQSKIMFGLAISAAAAVAGPVFAAGPQCPAKTFIVSQPATTKADIEFNPLSIGPACSDATGNEMTVTAVSAPGTLLTKKDGKSRNQVRIKNNKLSDRTVITFTVVDENNAGTTSTVTIIRQNPAG